MFAEDAGGPLAEAHASLGFDALDHGNDDIVVVVSRVVGFPIGGSYPEFPDSCLATQLILF